MAGAVILLVAVVLGSRVTIAAVPAKQAADNRAGDKCARPIASASAVSSAVMPTATASDMTTTAMTSAAATNVTTTAMTTAASNVTSTAMTTAATNVATATVATSIVAPMSAPVMTASVADVVDIATVAVQTANARRTRGRSRGRQARHGPNNQTGTECQSCEYHFLLPIHFPNLGPICKADRRRILRREGDLVHLNAG